MKNIKQYLIKEFKLNKNYKNPYNYHPKDKKELKDIVKKLIDERGFDADLNDIDVSQITDMSQLFYSSEFNGDISGWDVSNVTNMNHMFAGSEYSGKNGSIENWDVSNVIHMRFMFSHSQFDVDLSKWNVRNGVHIDDMFWKCPLEGNEPAWYRK